MTLKSKYGYETFNARYLSLEEVANTFIYYEIFDQLVSNNHTLLMGPRGCGKTTLLKMLTPKALFAYNSRNDISKTINLPFVGVYIPADKQWEKQLSNFSKLFNSEERFDQIVSNEIVNTNIYIALLNTFHDLSKNIYLQEEESLIKESEVCKILVEIFKIAKPISPTFYSLSNSLKNRISEINVLINKIEFGVIEIGKIKYPDYFFTDFLNIVDICCSEFETVNRERFEQLKIPYRWALCFDELEISPSWLQKKLITQNLRSTHQKFLFKLTTTPLVDAEYWLEDTADSTRPSQNEDYNVIRNWVFNNESNELWKSFSEKLFKTQIERLYNVDVVPMELFGNTQFNMNQIILEEARIELSVASKKQYSEGSVEWSIFKALAQNDESFFNFLVRKHISPLNPVAESIYQNDRIFRKIKPIAYFRFYFLKGIGALRSRKTVNLYSGIPLIYEMCDGNPRTLLNLIDNFRSRFKIDEVNKKLMPISISDQAKVIIKVSDTKLENIKNHPEANILMDNGRTENLGNLLSEIAEYYFTLMIRSDFTMDPFGTFIIDRELDPRIVKLLKFGLNIGAIQYIDPKQDISQEDLYNKEYRISFSLYPTFNLPIREYGKIHLSRILGRYKIAIKRRGRGFRGPGSVPELF